MKQLNTLFTAGLLVLLQSVSAFATARTAESYESIYTDLVGDKCVTIESDETGTGWYRAVCPGVGGYKLEVMEDDIRQSVNVVAPNKTISELNLWSNVSGFFSSVGEKAEWRVTKKGKNPVALIIRFNANEDLEKTEKQTSRLVVIKIMGDAACITDIVEPVKDANLKARQLADSSANRPCKFPPGSGEEESGDQIAETKSYAEMIWEFVEKEGKPHIIIADVADDEADGPAWAKFTSEEEFEKAREQREAYTNAYIWNKNGSVAQVNFTYSSQSGDWVEYYFQTYRPDGSLARAERELRTFMGNVIVNRIGFYDENGKLLKETKTYRDLNTEKPIDPDKRSFMDVEVGELYLKTTDLPFFGMLSAEGKSNN